jgi:L-aspartate oxidase
VHGANRLASNSLLEGLVFGRRIAETVMTRLAQPGEAAQVPVTASDGVLLSDDDRPELQALMSRDVGVLRDEKGLRSAVDGLAELANGPGGAPTTENWEATNLLTVASTLANVALRREETRGSHWRDDFPDRDDAWRGHLDSVLVDGRLETEFHHA